VAEREHVDRPETPVPPAGEPVHLPGPSYQPVLVAVGVSLGLSGIIISPIITVIGVILALVAIIRWMRDTRDEMSELPLEH